MKTPVKSIRLRNDARSFRALTRRIAARLAALRVAIKLS